MSDVQKPFDPTPVAIVVGALLLVTLIWFLMPHELTPEEVWGTDKAEKKLAEKSKTEKSKSGASATKGPDSKVALQADGETDLPVVEIQTTKGTIKAELFAKRAPETVENFIDLVKQGFYDGIIFHRVIPDFMLQTGDPKGTGTGGRTDKGLPPKRLADEFHPELRHDSEGILSMANSGPDTGDTQFFITCGPTPNLNDRHAVFGKVIEGMDVVQAIAHVPTTASPGSREKSRPIDPPKMIKVTMVGEDADKE